jgi:pimeloyl-ACP methyl ester carboxylesterase
MSLSNHITLGSNEECPTRMAQFEQAFAWRNFAIVMPDYYGFGASADRPQAFLDAECTARGNIDAYLAAVQLMNDRKVKIPEKLFTFGYSQGGFNSMANLKYVSQHPELQIKFTKVICGGSPFDVEMTWNAYTQGIFRHALVFVPLTVVSINENLKLGFGYDVFFKGAMLENWQDWILSKKYSTDAINAKFGTNDLSLIMSDDFMSRTGDAYNAIMATCRRNTLTFGWVPPTGTKIILYHSRQDDTVPYENLTQMKNYLDEVAPGCYTAYEGDNGGHVEAVVRYVVATIGEWR